MFNLTTLAPDPKPSKDKNSQNLFLWQAEAKPLPDLEDPSDDDVQEIVISDGDEETRLVFNAHETELVERVAGACNSAYVTSGTAGVEAFRKAVLDPGYTLSPPGRVQLQLMKKEIKIRGERVWKDIEQTPKRAAILKPLEVQQKRLKAFAEKVVERMQVVAVEAATERLQKSADQTLGEALRYLKSGSAGRSAVSSRQLVQDRAPFAGPEIAQLADALTQIATMRRELSHFQAGSGLPRSQIAQMGGMAVRPLLAEKLQEELDAQRLRQIASPDLLSRISAAHDRATRDTEAAQQLLAQECAIMCRTHPVLYRLWDQPIALEVADVWNNTPSAQRLAALAAETTLAPTLVEVLNTTSSAALAFVDALRSSPDDVWRYDAAVYAGLKRARLNQGDIAWRAVEEYLENFKGSMSTLSKMSLGLNAVEMLAATCAVAPPVAAILAITSTAAGVAELIETAVIEAGKDRAFAACLNPGDSLALEAGSYGGVVIGALFMLLQLRDTGKALGKVAK